jgi:hypothetical protein
LKAFSVSTAYHEYRQFFRMISPLKRMPIRAPGKIGFARTGVLLPRYAHFPRKCEAGMNPAIRMLRCLDFFV